MQYCRKSKSCDVSAILCDFSRRLYKILSVLYRIMRVYDKMSLWLYKMSVSYSKMLPWHDKILALHDRIKVLQSCIKVLQYCLWSKADDFRVILCEVSRRFKKSCLQTTKSCSICLILTLNYTKTYFLTLMAHLLNEKFLLNDKTMCHIKRVKL